MTYNKNYLILFRQSFSHNMITFSQIMENFKVLILTTISKFQNLFTSLFWNPKIWSNNVKQLNLQNSGSARIINIISHAQKWQIFTTHTLFFGGCTPGKRCTMDRNIFEWALLLWFGILLSKLFWPTSIVRKNCPIDQEKLLKFETEGWEFAKKLRSLEQFVWTVKGQNNFW